MGVFGFISKIKSSNFKSLLIVFLLLKCFSSSDAWAVSQENNMYTYLPDCDAIKIAQSHDKAKIQEVIDSGVDIDCQNKYSYTALMIAAEYSLEALDVLLDNGADTEITDKNGRTAIFYAIGGSRKIKALKRLIAAGANLDIRDINEETLLSKVAGPFSTEPENLKIAELILKAGADPDSRDGHGKTALMDNASGFGSHIDLLISYGADVDAKDQENRTALMWAAGYGSINSTKKILSHKPKINQIDANGKNEILYAAWNKNPRVLDLLKEAGVKVDFVDKDGCNGIFIAAQSENIPAIKWFCEHGIDINSTDKQGRNVIAFIVEEGDRSDWHYKEVVKELVALGADINQADKNGFTPVELATAAGKTKMVEILTQAGAKMTAKAGKIRQSEFTRLISSGADVDKILSMLEDGYDINAEDENGITPFAAAAMSTAKPEVLVCLLKHGANINVTDSHGRTMLMFLCYGNYDAAMLKPLLENYKDINKQDNVGVSLLILASAYRSCDIVELIIDAGADPNLKDSTGRTALFYAAARGNLKMVKQLIDAGADASIRDNQGQPFILGMMKNPDDDSVQEILTYATSKGLLNESDVTEFKKSRKAFKEYFEQMMKASVEQPESYVDRQISETKDIDAQDSDGKTLLMRLCEEGADAKSIKKVLNAGADLEIKCKDNWTALAYAINYAPYETVMALVNAGADDDMSDCDKTMLMLAANNPDARVLDYCLTRDSNINATTEKQKWTALMFASENTNPEIAKKLLAAGADINQTNLSGMDALMIAVSDCNLKVAKLLLEAGANPTTSRTKGTTPLEMAVRRHCSIEMVNLIAQVIGKTESVAPYAKEAIDDYFAMWAFDDDSRVIIARLEELSGEVPEEYYTKLLLRIVSYTNLETVRELIRLGADVNARNKDGLTVLMLAVGNRNLEVTKEILEQDVDINAISTGRAKGYTALHFALERNRSLKVAKALVKGGADLKNKELYGNLAKVAMRNTYKDALEFAEKLGCGKLTGEDGSYADSALLKEAVYCCDSKEVKRLLGKFHFSQKAIDDAFVSNCLLSAYRIKSYGETPVFEIAKELLSKGASIDITVQYGSTLLMRIAGDRKMVPMLGFLIDNGADVNFVVRPRDSTVRTALLVAAQNRNIKAIEKLLAAGADVSVVENKLLTSSIAHGDYDCIRLLIDAGAKIDPSQSGTVLGYLFEIPVEKREELFSLYTVAGLDINHIDPFTTETVFMKVCRWSHSPDEIQFLLDHGADVTIKDKRGHDAKYYLQKNSHLKDLDLF